LESLGKKGALTWPNPTTPENFSEVLVAATRLSDTEQLSFSSSNGNQSDDIRSEVESVSPSPGEQLFTTVRALLERLNVPKTDKEIANELNVKLVQAKEWIKRLVKEGVLEKVSKPTRYRSTRSSKLF